MPPEITEEEKAFIKLFFETAAIDETGVDLEEVAKQIVDDFASSHITERNNGICAKWAEISPDRISDLELSVGLANAETNIRKATFTLAIA